YCVVVTPTRVSLTCWASTGFGSTDLTSSGFVSNCITSIGIVTISLGVFRPITTSPVNIFLFIPSMRPFKRRGVPHLPFGYCTRADSVHSIFINKSSGRKRLHDNGIHKFGVRLMIWRAQKHADKHRLRNMTWVERQHGG
ncbi:MAG: hypothetical protein AAGK25_11205, partial [Pseudomonadota bacterium]